MPSWLALRLTFYVRYAFYVISFEWRILHDRWLHLFRSYVDQRCDIC